MMEVDIVRSSEYELCLKSLKEEVRKAQQRAVVQVNRELILTYHHIGSEIIRLQKEKGWGSKIIEQLSKDLQSAFPDMKGFSLRNLNYMRKFAEEYPEIQFVQQVAAQLPWFHIVTILTSVKDTDNQVFYMNKAIEHGWSRNVLSMQIEARLHERLGKVISNFENQLPSPLSDMTQQSLKDPYIFDFLTLHEKSTEKMIESALVEHIRDFLLELGEGFSFMGNQYRINVGGDDYYIDMLFYHTKLRCYIVIELKATAFKPEYTGQIGFYLAAVDDLLRHHDDNPTIGLILCRSKNNITAGYALKNVNAPIGVAEYSFSKVIPEAFKVSLPSVEELEAQLNRIDENIKKE